MRKIKKGSFTIEAALLMPLVLMILIGVLYLDFFVHDRAYLTAAAYEAAVSGSMEGYKKKGNIYEKADIQGRMLGDIEMLEDMIAAATNEALRQVESESAAVMSKLTGGLGGLGGGLPF